VWRSSSIEMRLRNVSAINACLLVMAGLVGVVSLSVAGATVQDVVSRLDPLAETNREILQSLTDSERSVRDFAVAGDEQFLAPMDRGAVDFEAALVEARGLAGDDAELIRLLDVEDDLGHRWLDTFARPLVATHPTDPATALPSVATGEGPRLFEDFRRANTETQGAIGVQVRESADRVRTLFTAMTVFGVLVTLVAATTGLLLARRAGRWISNPLRALVAALARITGGDLRVRVPASGPNEVAEVAGAFNEMAGEVDRLTTLERQRAGQERLIRETSRDFLEHLEEADVLTSAVTSVARAMSVERTEIWEVRDGGAGDQRAMWVRSENLRQPYEFPPPELVDLVDEAFGDYGLARIDDVGTDPTLLPAARAYLQRQGVRAILLAPLRAFERVAAVLCIERCEDPRPWTDPEVTIAQGLARELGVALEHARVFAQQRTALDELRRLDEAKAVFVSSISHELRTPLASIVGSTEMLLDGDAGELVGQQRTLLDMVDRNGHRLMALIDDLLMLSRIDSGGLQRARTRVDIGAVIDGAMAAVGPLLKGRHLILRIDHPDDLPPVRGDRSDLERVVINLLSNAFKFTGDGGSVAVTASAIGSEVAIAVSDTGMGIPPEEHQQLFSRFFQSSTTRAAQTPGTGLGLAIVKGIVDDHGGRVEVRSMPGVGSAFTVWLPVMEPSDEVLPGRGEIVRSLPVPGTGY
jgi:two-component system, OmpR family, phosphate regulon sensor histidine kinase PhoR